MAAQIIIEDGTGASASANAYVTVAEVDSFCESFGLSSWATLATNDKITAIIRATAYIDSLPFKGLKYDYDNPLEWPRVGALTDVVVDPTLEPDYQEIPVAVKKASCRAAYEESVEPGVLQSPLSQNIASEKVGGAVEVSYFENKSPAPIYTAIEGFLKGLLTVSEGGRSGNGFATVVRT
jgi:hypothetical protein